MEDGAGDSLEADEKVRPSLRWWQRIRDILWPRAIFRGWRPAGGRQSSDARARRSMLKRLNLGCADRRQKPGARRPDHSESGVADVEAGGVDMDEQARPQTGRRPLDRISSPPPRDRALVSFRAPDAAPAPHTTPPIPRDGPAGVRGGRRAHHARRSREAQPTTHHASTRHGHQTRARVSVPRPRHHDSRHGDATDIRAAHRRLRARRAGGGFEARRRRRRRLERRRRQLEAPTTRGARATRRSGARGGCSSTFPRRTNAEHHSKGYRSRDGSREVGGGAAPRTVRRRFGERFGEARRRTKSLAAANRASDPRVADKIGLRDGDGVRSFDKDTTSPHHNTSHSLVSPAHLVFLKRLGATHLSTHPHMSKYCPVQCASPVVSFSTRATHASYAAMNFAHLGLHASSRSGL